MKQINRKICAAIAGLLVLGLVQTAAASSIFSRTGVGIIRYNPGAMAMGMGGVGLADANVLSIPHLNPAGLSFTSLTRFEGSFLFENTDVTFSADDARFAKATFNTFRVIFPVKSGFGLGLGLEPFSDVAYKLVRPVEYEGNSGAESLTGSGGLQHGFIELGGKITNWLRVGASFDAYFGRIENTWRLIFDDPSFNPSVDETSTYIDGIGGHVGLILQLGKHVDAGAVFYFPTTLTAETQRVFQFGDQTEKQVSDLKLPFAHGYGLTITPYARFQAGVDLFLQSWSDIQPDEFLSVAVDNTYRLGVGLAYTPSTEFLAGFLSRLTYRAGFNTSTLPYLNANGDQIHENLVSFGLGVPFNFGVSKIDFGFEYGKRGSLEKFGAEEKIFRFVLTVTGGERWFLR